MGETTARRAYPHRTVTKSGYVLIYQPEHHLSDVRGYVYEHRLVAEQKIGRPLIKGEMIHHIDGNAGNNHPDNLEVVSSHEAHRLLHRSAKSILRLPGDQNPIIECACGCGVQFEKYDSVGRPRQYVSGHNPMVAPSQKALLDLLMEGPLRTRDLISLSGLTKTAAAMALSRLNEKGMIRRVKWGFWEAIASHE
ncbi:MAG: HNH endonuclease [Dehalococcoidia bacterium]|jgi:hypothetical protein